MVEFTGAADEVYPSGVKPSTTSNLAASSPIREPGIGAKSTVTEARASGSRMLL